MILRPFTEMLATVLVTGACIALGLLTFGNGIYFDLASFAFLLVIAFFCRHDLDLMGVLALLTISYAIEEIAYWVLLHMTIWPVFIYFIALAAIVKFRSDKLSDLVAVCLLLVLAAEWYWWFTDYDKPDLSWSITLMIIALITRYYFKIRPDLIEQLCGYDGDYISTDKKIRDIYGIYMIIEGLSILEYLIRHLTPLKPLYIYQVYPYVIQILSTYTLWVVLQYSQKLVLKKSIKA